jgi:integrase
VATKNLDRYVRLRGSHPQAQSEWLWLCLRGRFQSAGIARMIERRAKQANIAGLHPHVFRHTFAHSFRSHGGSEGDLMVLGGWRSRTMVDRYGRAAAADRAGEAHSRFSPLDNL